MSVGNIEEVYKFADLNVETQEVSYNDYEWEEG